MPDEYLTSSDVAELAGVKTESIYRYRSRGTIPPPDLSFGNTPVWLRPTIETWLATRPPAHRPARTSDREE